MASDLKKIIVVDDNDSNLLACKNILKGSYTVYPAPSADRMFNLLEHISADLILLDVEMPEMDGYEASKILLEKYKDVPFIFLTGNSNAESEIKGIQMGAIDYFQKPFVAELILKRIANHIALIESKRALKSISETLEQAAGTDDTAKVKELITQAKDAARALVK